MVSWHSFFKSHAIAIKDAAQFVLNQKQESPPRFPLLDLPYDLVIEIIKKMPVPDILSLRLACSAMNALIERHRLSLPCRSFPEVEIHPLLDSETHLVYDEEKFAKLFKNGIIAGLTFSYMDITEELLCSIKRTMERNRIYVERLGFDYCRISTSAESFAELVQLSQAFELSIVHCVAVVDGFSSELASSYTIRQLERFGMLLPAEITDNYLLESRNEWLAVIGTSITLPAIKQFVEDWVECRRSFEYVALELSDEIDANEILADLDCELIDGNWSIRNKRGELRTIGICENCIQIFSDDAIAVIEQNM
ncbi:hypothetical protein Q1695_007601 [Nippostrongylus brasiliensis]|nr:hypothetical protein Q1695_007601 [Nippostrongylus brasiliensis]